MGSAGCRAARLKSQSARLAAATQSAPSSAPSLGRRSARELGSISSSAETAPLCWFELGAVPQHRMHDDGETTGERHLGLAHCRSFGDREGPFLKLHWSLIAGQHDVGRLVEERTNAAIAALRDAARVINLAGLIAPRHQTEIRANVARSPEASGVIDCRCEGKG